MDEKTENLREIFLDVADGETVTERQDADRGSLAVDEAAVDDRLQSVIGDLREEFTLATDLDDEALCRVVRQFHAGESDQAMTTTLGVTPGEITRARLSLHLVREECPDSLVAAVRDRVGDQTEAVDDAETRAIARARETDEEAVAHAARVVVANNRARRVDHRFRRAFEEILTDADLTEQFTDEAQADGLEEATEGAEVDVEF